MSRRRHLHRTRLGHWWCGVMQRIAPEYDDLDDVFPADDYTDVLPPVPRIWAPPHEQPIVHMAVRDPGADEWEPYWTGDAQ